MNINKENKANFLPAAHFHFLTKFYDRWVHLFFNRTLNKICSSLPLHGNEKVLDIGCGPGNLLLKIHEKFPKTELTGIDIDPEMVAIAERKSSHIQAITIKKTSAATLPFPDNHFDILISTLVFHHLKPHEKISLFQEAHRVLKPGGSFWLFDFGQPQNWLAKMATFILKHFENIEDNIQNKIPVLYEKSGFTEVKTHWYRHGITSLVSGEKFKEIKTC